MKLARHEYGRISAAASYYYYYGVCALSSGRGSCDWLDLSMESPSQEASFPAHLFPASFTLLYCPFSDCAQEAPFTSADALVEHVRAPPHRLPLRDTHEIIPFLDRYLSARLDLAHGDPSGLDISEGEDADLRDRLQQERLREILEIQAQERQSVHRRGRFCLFCPTHCENLPRLFSHMFQTHGFNIGQLDNLVMVDEFLSSLQRKLDQLVCIYCEGVFPNAATIKKHLKNKNHYKIHPQNHIYDKYYVVNYLRPGKLYDEETARAERDADEVSPKGEQDEGAPVTVSDAEKTEQEWQELDEPVEQRTTCLLCPRDEGSPEDCLAHMRDTHSFDWHRLVAAAGLDTYESIKLINYMRVCYAEVLCMFCAESLATEEALQQHLTELHAPFDAIPEKKYWKDPRFLFPIYEDDPLVCFLDDET